MAFLGPVSGSFDVEADQFFKRYSNGMHSAGEADQFSRIFDQGMNPAGEAQQFFNMFNEMNSAVKWNSAASIVSLVISAVAIVAIVYAIIDCLKKTGTAIPSYAQSARHDIEKGLINRSPSSNKNSELMPLAQVYPVIPDSEIKGATMDIFLGKMARERPLRFSRKQLEECTKGFKTILGSGSYGVVYKGEFPDGLQVAVKWLKNKADDQKVQEQFMAEMSTLGRTYHKNLVRLCGFCFDPDIKALVYEFMENGSLNKILFGADESTIVIYCEKLYEIAIGIAKGISYLHEECQPAIIHYDIKPGNVLLDKDLHPKVADFGLAKLCNPEISLTSNRGGFRGTRAYAAPEFWNWNAVTHKCDVYSFGIMLLEILGRRRNEDAAEKREFLSRRSWEMFEKGELSELFSLLDVEAKDTEKAERMCKVALWCIQHLPEARPKMSDVVKMLEGGMEIPQPSCPFEHSEVSSLGSDHLTNLDDIYLS